MMILFSDDFFLFGFFIVYGNDDFFICFFMKMKILFSLKMMTLFSLKIDVLNWFFYRL